MQNILLYVMFIFNILCILIKNYLMINLSSNICVLILCWFNNCKIIENKTSNI